MDARTAETQLRSRRMGPADAQRILLQGLRCWELQAVVRFVRVCGEMRIELSDDAREAAAKAIAKSIKETELASSGIRGVKFIANPECITALGYLCFRSGARAVSLHATAYAEISRVPLANTSFLALESLLVESKPSCILAINGLLLDLVQGVFAPPYTSTNSGSDVSECSDAESTTTHRHHKKHCESTKYAILCVRALAKHCQKEMYQHWSKFLPSQNNISNSLTKIITSHPCDRVRYAACDLLVAFFTDSKRYLAIAGGSETKASFTTLSEKVGAQLLHTVNAILTGIKAGRSHTIITQKEERREKIIKTIETQRNGKGRNAIIIPPDGITKPGDNDQLVEKLQEAKNNSLIEVTKMVSAVTLDEVTKTDATNSNDESYQAKFNTVEEVTKSAVTYNESYQANGQKENLGQPALDINLMDHLFEVLNVMLQNCPFQNIDPFLPQRIYEIVNYGWENSSALPRRMDCIGTIVSNELLNQDNLKLDVVDIVIRYVAHENNAIQIASLNLLSVLAKSAPETTWHLFIPHIQKYLKSGDVLVRVSAMKMLEQFCYSCGPEGNLKMTAMWWTNIFNDIPWNDEIFTIRVLGCNILAYLSRETLESIPRKLRYQLITIVLASFVDEHPDVRAAGISPLTQGAGSIGVLVAYPIMYQDNLLMIDLCASIATLVKDPILNVRIRSSWAIGNLATSIHLYQKESLAGNSDEQIPISLISELMQVAILASKDHEKCKSHGVRAIGNIFLLFIVNGFMHQNFTLIHESIDVVIKNIGAGPFKVRWNACYALKLILSSFELKSNNPVPWDPTVLFECLCAAITGCNNFKVKIGAIAAICSPKQVQLYGRSKKEAECVITKCINALIDVVFTMENALKDAPFGEHSYKQQLQAGIVECQRHLCIICESKWGPNLELLGNEMSSLQSILSLPDLDLEPIWSENVYRTLNFAVSECKNVKVKISAINIIYTPQNITLYGPSYHEALVFLGKIKNLVMGAGHNIDEVTGDSGLLRVQLKALISNCVDHLTKIETQGWELDLR